MHRDVQIGNNKLIQLEQARNCGLTVPLTLFSNTQAEVRTFFERCNGQMITKMHGVLHYGMQGGGQNFPTTQLQRADLEEMDTLHLCPMIFQELIPKQVELRIAYVDGQCFTGAINASGSQTGKTDWRYAHDVKLVWEHYALPEDVRTGLHRMMQAFGLPFGAIDMIVTPDGRHVFLEVNPQGEWGMLQRDLDLPIGQAIAEKLIEKIKQQ
jgi:glutathione synthase/RimK-type ligase-like ATP-grasp enzyme